MRGAIFCLFSFCVVQTVFTNDLQKMKELREEALLKIHDAEPEMLLIINAEQEAAERKGVTRQMSAHCLKPHCAKWHYYFVHERQLECEKCYDKAVKRMDIELAKKCCIEQIADLGEHAGEDIAVFKKCVEECVRKAGADARIGTKRGREGQKEN